MSAGKPAVGVDSARAAFAAHPAADGIDVWWLDLAELPHDESTFAPHLTADETVEIARFKRAEDRRARAGARTFLRFVLGRYYLDLPPLVVHWTRDAHDRPELPSAPAGFDFNLSHAGPHVLVAVSPSARVGVDIEVPRRVDVPAMARLCATETERRWLAAAGTEAEEQRRFFRLWTMKEAVLKCHGLGFGCDPRYCEVAVEAGTAELRGPGEGLRSFRVAALPVGSAALGAIAWPGPRDRSWQIWRAPVGWLES